MGLGWPTGVGLGPAPTPISLYKGVKNTFEQKTRGLKRWVIVAINGHDELKTRGLAKFSVFRLLQQPVMPMISIHIFARGKRPRTRTTGAKRQTKSANRNLVRSTL